MGAAFIPGEIDFRAAWDSQYLYLAARCYHKLHPNDMQELRRRVGNRADAIYARQDERVQAESLARSEFRHVPFPRNGDDPYYREQPTEVIEAFATNTPLYLTSIVIANHGAIDNLPANAVVDIPAVAVGGEVRGVHVGPLPAFGAELCRRQIAIHELLVEAAVSGDRVKLRQSLALDPYVRSLKQARDIADDFLAAYRAELPQFWS